MIPVSVLSDPMVTHRQVRVFGVIATGRRGVYSTIGQRLLSETLRLKRKSVRADITHLVDLGHLAIEPAGKGKRTQYRLTSPVFARGKAANRPAALAVPVAPALRAAAKLTCSACRKRVRGLGITGVCRSCKSTARVEFISRRVAREEIARSA